MGIKKWGDLMNVKMLNEKIQQSGLSGIELANMLEIDEATLYRKKNGTSDFYRREIQVMKSALKLTNDEVDTIFFDN